MSVHSRSSSELDTIPCGEILQVFIKHFLKDFEFDDVKERVRTIFTDEELEYIVKEKGEAQIQHMLWILANKNDRVVMKFMEYIAYDYKWIVEKVRIELTSHSFDTLTYVEKLRAIQNKHQKHTDYNVHRTVPYIKLRRYLTQLNINRKNGVVLLGDIGSGKKWLAVDVCSDFSVMKCMGFKIFWIDCTNCTDAQQDYNALKRLMIQLNPTHNFCDQTATSTLAEEIASLKAHIKLLLNSKEFNSCLLVLANVRNVKAHEAFNIGCKRLIITRFPKVSDSLTEKLNKHLHLDKGLDIGEFHLMLDKYIKMYNWREYASFASDIYHLSNGDPYILSIIAKHLQIKKSNWTEWKKNLDTLQIPDEKFRRDIENSLGMLSEDQLHLYATLSVFPHCAKIPVKLLAILWNKELRDADRIILKLDSNSFVKKDLLEDNDTMVCSLKYVYSSYIKNCPKIQSLIKPKELHQAIVKYYGVEEHLDVRKEVDLFYEPHYDCYFFRCIGYHIYGANCTELFPRLYMDFGFLGQKIRKDAGLSNTIADLTDYNQEILQNNPERMLRIMISFLANVEEKLLHSQDCSLLQYALLSTEEHIKELALQQIKRFPQRLWFKETGQFHQRCMIASLPHRCKLVRILDNDVCLTVLSDNGIYLVDISLNGNMGAVQLIPGTAANIEHILLFNEDSHLLTLDQWGQLKLWNIDDEVRRIIEQRCNKSDGFTATTYKLCPQQSYNRKFKQCINDNIRAGRHIVACKVTTCRESTSLHVALDNGDIMNFEWMPQFEEFRTGINNVPCKTNILNIECICVVKSHWMILDYNNGAMNITFVYQRNSGKVDIQFPWPRISSHFVYCDVHNRDDSILLVFGDAIVLLKPIFGQGTVVGTLEALFQCERYKITCAKLSQKNNLLVMGTEHGLQVLDVNKGGAMLHTFVSEKVKCVDIYDLDDKEYQHMVVCGIENKSIVYLLALLKTKDNALVWQHNTGHSIALENITAEERRNIRLKGHRLFDYSGGTTLFAVDTKKRVLQICTSESKSWEILQLPNGSASEITATCCKHNKAFVATTEGLIYDVHQKSIVAQCLPSPPIEYLKLINDDVLVASTASGKDGFTDIVMLNCNIFRQKFVTKFCAFVMDAYFLFVTDHGAVVSSRILNDKINENLDVIPVEYLADCDLKANVLFLGFSKYLVHIYTLRDTGKKIDYQGRCEIGQKGTNYIITCLCASSDGKLFAIGLNTIDHGHMNNNSLMETNPSSATYNYNNDNLRSCGDIEIYKLDDDFKGQLIYVLKSHNTPVCDMRFSPQSDVLVSLSEQICFWSISYILNNPSDMNRRKRLSSRFSSQRSTEEVDANVWRRGIIKCVNDVAEQLKPIRNLESGVNLLNHSFASDDSDVFGIVMPSAKDENIWLSLTGPGDKPELLSCLKLDGNVAKQIFSNSEFTQFFTIDDEGVYYNLNVIPPPPIALPVKEDSPDSVDMADSYADDVTNDIPPSRRMQRLSISSNASGVDVVDDAMVAPS